jgi:predicted AAA+ superfamily ATPase
MYERLQRISLDDSVLLLGPRGVGKSTLLQQLFPKERAIWYDLLIPEVEDRLAREPSLLIREVKATPNSITHVVIDEIQKVPPLLDVVHHLIESTSLRFVLTGSSARKLKRNNANLLAGRAFVFELYPLTSLELGADFDLQSALGFGTLPKVIESKNTITKRRFLQTYALTYLKEEIQVEQVVRQLDPFRKFLQVCAQSSGKILNFAAQARDVGVDEKTIKNYYSIMEDTLLGFFLEPYHASIRKRLTQKPKFYLFDTGVQRALSSQLTLPVQESTSAYGELFEAFVINECMRLSRYAENDFAFHYLATRDGVEVDLVVERPGKPLLLIEIKSSVEIQESHLKGLRQLGGDFPGAQCICMARVIREQKIDDIFVLPWQMAVRKIFWENDF